MKKFRVLFVNPINKNRRGFAIERGSRFPPLALGILAALTPQDIEFELIDENFDDFEWKEADLVAITSFTTNIVRAYEIAGICRNHGAKVVMGGIHVSMLPDEALNYCDSVVIGEAEGVWPQVLKDFRDNQLKPSYKSSVDQLNNNVIPRHDVFHPDYLFASVQTSRGCPMDCEFCSVTRFNGRKYRERPVEDIIEELKTIKAPSIFFVDDHLVNAGKKSQERAIALFKAMIKAKINRLWFSQASVNFADNTNVLKWARKSGCSYILLGIESEKTEQLREINKNMNISRGTSSYKKLFGRMHRYGIGVLGALIFGMDSDNAEDIRDRFQFARSSGIDCLQTTLLTPLPGTRLFERMEKQGRIIKNNYPSDWEHYHFFFPVLQPAQMDGDELVALMHQYGREYYRKENLRKLLWKTLWRTRSLSAAFRAYTTNFSYGRIMFEEEITDETRTDGLNFNLEDRRGRSKFLKRTDFLMRLFYLALFVANPKLKH